ncbi:hypothetical protein H7X68_01715 [Candidatus Saccharibacteria bacterium]|nr:hypothetical protein [Candidatus Saccharibacteria bacterium]
MATEQLPPLHKDEKGEDEPTFWAGERVDEGALDDDPNLLTGLARLSREELASLSVEISPPSATKPPEEDSDTY